MFLSVPTWQNFKALWQLYILPNTKDSLACGIINLKTILIRFTNMSLWELVLEVIVCIYVSISKCQEVQFDLSHCRLASHLSYLNIPKVFVITKVITALRSVGSIGCWIKSGLSVSRD